jgi:hypothetical protein
MQKAKIGTFIFWRISRSEKQEIKTRSAMKRIDESILIWGTPIRSIFTDSYVYELTDQRILLDFHREGGQLHENILSFIACLEYNFGNKEQYSPIHILEQLFGSNLVNFHEEAASLSEKIKHELHIMPQENIRSSLTELAKKLTLKLQGLSLTEKNDFFDNNFAYIHAHIGMLFLSFNPNWMWKNQVDEKNMKAPFLFNPNNENNLFFFEDLHKIIYENYIEEGRSINFNRCLPQIYNQN